MEDERTSMASEEEARETIELVAKAALELGSALPNDRLARTVRLFRAIASPQALDAGVAVVNVVRTAEWLPLLEAVQNVLTIFEPMLQKAKDAEDDE